MAAVRIHNISKETWYVAGSRGECKDKTDRSAYVEAVRFRETVSMGKVVAEYLGGRG